MPKPNRTKRFTNRQATNSNQIGAYGQGYLAAVAGQASRDNPYTAESDQHAVWLWGYTDYALDIMGPCAPRQEPMPRDM